MANIQGIELGSCNSWMLEAVNTSKTKKAKGVVVLLSTQNSEKHLIVWMKMIESLNPYPEKVIFCENDSSDKTVELINQWKFPHELISFKSKQSDAKKDIYAVVARNRQLLLERARGINPKFAIYMDDDVFPDDQDIIKRLISHKLDIVGGAYLRHFELGTPRIASKWDINTSLKDLPPLNPKVKNKIKELKENGYKYLLLSSCEYRLYKVALTSAGCLCLSKKIIQDKRINFFPRKNLDYEDLVSEDFKYCLLARKYDYEVYLDGNSRLSHLGFDYKEKKRPWILVEDK